MAARSGLAGWTGRATRDPGHECGDPGIPGWPGTRRSDSPFTEIRRRTSQLCERSAKSNRPNYCERSGGMFSGIVETTGCLSAVDESEVGVTFVIEAPSVLGDLHLGDSVNVDGV